jgi:hypothetical protein
VNAGPEFSVIMPVCHGGGLLRAALASAHSLEAGPGGYEVIVPVPEDDVESRRAIEEAAAGPAQVRCVPCASRNRSAMLNAAWRTARGRVLAFTDDDCAVPPNWLAGLGSALQDGGRVGLVGGGEEHTGGRGAFDAALDWVLQSLVARSGLRGAPRSEASEYYPRLWNMAIPGQVAQEVAIRADGAAVQLFDESLEVHEDVEVGERIKASGRRIAFAPGAPVRHARDTTYGALLGRNFAMARACRRLGVHRAVQRVAAGSLLAGAVLAVAAAFWPWARVALAVCAAVYGALMLACAAAAAATTRRLAAGPWTVLMLLGLHLARGAGYLLPARPGKRNGGHAWPG